MPAGSGSTVPGAGGGSNGAAETGSRYMRAFAASLAACSEQAQAYGQCLSARLPDVQRGGCEREFQALKGCFYAEFKRRAARRK